MMEERRREREALGLSPVSEDDVAAIQPADGIHKHISMGQCSREHSWTNSDFCRE